MAYMNWNEKLQLNIPDMDSQHKRWISILNELHEAVNSGKAAERIGLIINQLVNYTKTHLAAEEKFLKSIRYPDLAAHEAIHREMTDKVMEFQAKYDAGDRAITIQIISFVREWLVNHIQTVDRKYAQYHESTRLKVGTQNARV